jgi:hypothetical protein
MPIDPNVFVNEAERNVGVGFGIGFLSYPINLMSDEEQHFMAFTPVRLTKVMIDADEVRENLAPVAMCMPVNITDSLNLNYADFEGGFLGSVMESWKGNEEGFQFSEIIGRTLMSMGGDNAKTIASGNGIAFNPRQSVAFQNPQLKIHSFLWNMIARSAEESITIERILRKFRYHSLPGFQAANNKSFYEYPEVWDIRFSNGDWMPRINLCVCTSVTVTYNGSSTPIFFQDTLAPVEVTLSLEMKEIIAEDKELFVSKLIGEYQVL